MATKKKPTTRRTITTIEEPNDERDELDAFDRARLDFSGEPGVKLTLYRYDDGETAYLKRVAYDPGTVDEEWIRKRWGAGSYQLRFTDEAGSRHWSKVIHIATDETPKAAAPVVPSSSSEYIETLRRQNEIMLQAMLARANAPAGAPAVGGTEAIVALIQGMQAQNAELLRASLNRPDVSSTILQVLERGMSIAAESRLDAEGGWMAQAARIAKELLPALSDLTRARTEAMRHLPATGAGPGVPANPPGLPPGGGAPSPGVNGETKPAPTPEAKADTIDLDEVIRNFSPSILDAIQTGAAPEDVADSILGYIPPAYYDTFEQLSADRAIRVAPALSQHRGYVERLVAAMKDSGGEEET